MAAATLTPQTPEVQTQPLCSKCGAELDSEGYPKWCKACRKLHKAEWERTRKEMTESRGFAAGVSAMRSYLVKRFANYGTQGNFSGLEVAQIIRQCTGPDQVD